MTKKFVGRILAVFFFIIFLFYFYWNRQDFAKLVEIELYYIISIILLKLIILFFNGLCISVFLRGYKLYMPLLESYYLSYITTWGNYFGPLQSGLGLRALYLKRKYDFPLSLFLTTMYGNYILVFFVNGIISLLTLAMIYEITGITSYPLILFFTTVVLVTAVIIYFPSSSILFRDFLLKGKIAILHKLSKIFQGWIKLRKNRSLIYKLILLTLSNFFLWSIMYYLEYKAIGINLSIPQTLLFTTITSSTILVSITPGGIGIREGIQLLFSKFIGISELDVIAVAILDRGLLFLSLILLYIFFLKYKKEIT